MAIDQIKGFYEEAMSDHQKLCFMSLKWRFDFFLNQIEVAPIN